MAVTVNTPEPALLAGATQVCQQSLHKFLLHIVRLSWSIAFRFKQATIKVLAWLQMKQFMCSILCQAKLRWGCQIFSGITQRSNGPGSSILHLKYLLALLSILILLFDGKKQFTVFPGQAARNCPGQSV